MKYSGYPYKYVSVTIQVNMILTCVYEKSKIPFSYMLYAYSVKEPIGELNLKRTLDEDTGVSFIFFSTGSNNRFWEFHPSSVILGVFVFFFILTFCESLAYVHDEIHLHVLIGYTTSHCYPFISLLCRLFFG